MRILRSRFFVGAVCLLLAAAFSFVFLPRLLSSQRSTTQIVRLTKDVNYGEELKSEHLTKVEVGAYGLPEDVISTSDGITGKVAASKLYKGDYVTADKLISKEDYSNLQSEVDVFKDYEALVTLTMPSDSSAVGGILKSGDYVDAYRVDATTGIASAVEGLKNIRIYDVLNKSLQSIGKTVVTDETSGDESAKVTVSDLAPKFIIFAVTSEQAASLLTLEYETSLRLVYDNIVNNKGGSS